MSLLFPLFFLQYLSKSALAADLNVGTTLFTKADSCKECWSSESLALLTSRMILEDLLPSTSILVIDSNEFVTDLVEYFRMILEIVRQETHGKTKHITLLALTDLLGGYLHHAVLPIAKYAYYAGLIDYDSMATLLGLFDELKWFLRTNGQGWAKPLPQSLENFEIQRIPLQPPLDKSLCENLMFVEGDHRNSDKEPDRCDAIIPMPFFDSITSPSAIALPTKTCPLHNVEANTSSYLIMKFFVTAYKCLQIRNVKTENMEKFQNNFCGWIEEQIMPRFDDEKFYAAFGGILRVRNTLKRLGVSQKNNFEKQIDEFRHTGEEPPEQHPALTDRQMNKTGMILTAVLITIFVWFILGTMFICYKMRQSKQKPCSPEGGDGTTPCTSLASSRYFYPERPERSDKPKPKGIFGRRKAIAATPESDTDDLEDSDYKKRRKNQKHEIHLSTCHCKPDKAILPAEDDEAEEDTLTPASAAVLETSNTEKRLPSITEISELSSTTAKSRGHKTSRGGSTTAGSDRRSRVQHQVYLETESETEETSEPV